MYIDRIDLSLPETQIQAVLEFLGSAAETIQLLPSVSLSDRKRLAKLGLKNEALALQIIEVGRLHPDLITRGIDFEKIDRDRVAREQLLRLKIVLEGLLGKVNDSMLLTGVDLYAAALSIYHSLRRNAGTTSLRDTVNELKKGFARPSRRKKEKQEQPAAAAVLVSNAAAVSAPEPRPDASRLIHLQTMSEGAQRRDAAATMEVRGSNVPASPKPAQPQALVPAATLASTVPVVVSNAPRVAVLPSTDPRLGAAELIYFSSSEIPVFVSGSIAPQFAFARTLITAASPDTTRAMDS